MKSKDIDSVGLRLEHAVRPMLFDDMTSQEVYEAYEQAAIQILDSEFDNWPEGVLETYLLQYLIKLANKLGLTSN